MKKDKKLRNKAIKVFTSSAVKYCCEYGISFSFALYATDPLTVEKMYQLVGTLLILFIVYLITTFISVYNCDVFYSNLEINIDKKYFEKLSKMNIKKIIEQNTGFIRNLISEYGIKYRVLICDLIEETLPFIIGIGSFLYIAFKESITVGIVSFVTFITIIITRYFFNIKSQKLTKNTNEKISKYKGVLIDFISNIKTVIKLNSNRFAIKKITEEKVSAIESLNRENKYYAFVASLYDFITDLMYIILLILFIILLKNGRNIVGYLIFYITIMNKVVRSLKHASLTLNTAIKFLTTKKQLNECIGILEEKKLVNKFDSIKIINGEFSYQNSKIKIYIPNFEFNKGDKICLTGESGQGKSTLLNILIGINNLNYGSLLINDVKTKNKIINSTYVSQEIDIFNMSIKDNILLGKDVNEQKLLELFNEAGLSSWYDKLQNGLEEPLGEKGVKVSVGQKQRLNIIRGLLNDTEVYIFDEPTSNLDSESEEKIVELIKKYLKDKSFIIVSHRDAVKKICNKFYKFEDYTLKECE